MLEWYRKDSSYIKIMEELESLLRVINNQMKKTIRIPNGIFPRISLNKLFKEKCGISLDELLVDEKKMYETAQAKGYEIGNSTWEELYDQLFVNEIEASFSKSPFFLVDFPARISPLCKAQKNNSLLAERFELYMNGVEIANGNTEKTNAQEIRAVFEIEQSKTKLPMDNEFLDSIESMKDGQYAGVGLGVDRLTMLYTGTDIFV